MKLFLNKSVEIKTYLKQRFAKSLSMLTMLTALTPKLAVAAGTGGKDKLLGADSLVTLQETISGPVLTSISIIMVVVTCVMLAFGEWGDGFKRLIQIVLWISVAAGASSMIGTIIG